MVKAETAVERPVGAQLIRARLIWERLIWERLIWERLIWERLIWARLIGPQLVAVAALTCPAAGNETPYQFLLRILPVMGGSNDEVVDH
jgi:hypothetical protein